MQSERRRDPEVWTWEPVAAAFLILTALAAVVAQLGRSSANIASGAGWTWPTGGSESAPPYVWFGPTFWTSTPAVLGGHSSAGLAAGSPSETRPLAGQTLTLVSVIGAEALLLAVAVLVGLGALRRWGPSRLRGAATVAEAAGVLGVRRLRAVRSAVRPDLHHGGRSRGQGWEHDVGWPLGTAVHPRAGALWVPWDRTTGVIGPQGSGKTLDLLVPALVEAPGPALVTLTKVEDMLMSLTARAAGARPCLVLDPFGLTTGLASDWIGELVWDPVAGCVDSGTAERRAKAFTAGTVGSASRGGTGDDAARFYAAEAAKVLQCYLHAAALAGRTIDDVLRWVASPQAASEPTEILRRHPAAAPFWHGLLQGAIRGDDRTSSNTATTVQQAMSLFFQRSTRVRCVPTPGRPATDIADVLRRNGTVYLLGREDPYASASPLLTAVAEHVLDTALQLANESPHGGRLCPPMLACLDELPSTAPLPTLRTRMANERALGISIIWAAQTRAQLESLFGDRETRAMIGLTNVLAVFGGSKDVTLNRELSELTGTTRVARRSRSAVGRGGGTVSGDDIPVLSPHEIRALPDRHVLVIAENARPIVTRLVRYIEGRAGRVRLEQQQRLRNQLGEALDNADRVVERTAHALVESRRLGFADPSALPDPDRP